MYYLKSYTYLPSLKAMVNAVATVVQGNLIKMERWMDKKAVVHIHNGVLFSH